MAHDTLLTYPYFNETFKIHTDAIKFKLGAVIGHRVKLFPCYSRKLTDSQKRNTLTEKGVLSIVGTLK